MCDTVGKSEWDGINMFDGGSGKAIIEEGFLQRVGSHILNCMIFRIDMGD